MVTPMELCTALHAPLSMAAVVPCCALVPIICLLEAAAAAGLLVHTG